MKKGKKEDPVVSPIVKTMISVLDGKKSFSFFKDFSIDIYKYVGNFGEVKGEMADSRKVGGRFNKRNLSPVKFLRRA